MWLINHNRNFHFAPSFPNNYETIAHLRHDEIREMWFFCENQEKTMVFFQLESDYCLEVVCRNSRFHFLFFSLKFHLNLARQPNSWDSKSEISQYILKTSHLKRFQSVTVPLNRAVSFEKKETVAQGGVWLWSKQEATAKLENKAVKKE